ncbi:MAG: glycosyltransferase family 61 protein [Pseudomonadota bacterium]
MGFFPEKADVVEAADHVLADEFGLISPEWLSPDVDFLRRCRTADTADPAVDLTAGITTGRRTVLYDHAWIDASTGSILLPRRRQTVLVRGGDVNWNAGSIRFGRQRLRVQGLAMPLLNTTNYFHLLLENGLRVIDLLESGHLADAPLTLINLEDRGRVDGALYKGIRTLYPNVSVERVPEGVLVMPDQTLCHFPRDPYWEWPPVDTAAAKRLLNVFEAVYGEIPTEKSDDRLYVTRGSAKLRQPDNGKELRERLEARGFQGFTASDDNHPEQISRFASASVIVSIHGAGLTNLLFCQPGTRVIEIFPANFLKSPYWWLARRLGLAYTPVIGGPGNYAQHFAVNMDALDNGLQQAGVTS